MYSDQRLSLAVVKGNAEHIGHVHSCQNRNCLVLIGYWLLCEIVRYVICKMFNSFP